MVEDLSSPVQSGVADPTWVDEVIHFWFAELTEAQWFVKDDALDQKIRSRFLALHERLVTHDGLGVSAPRPILAAVVALDQFSRNMFRGSARAYAADAIARRLARTAVDQGFDLALTGEQRYCLYLPFEHSETSADQALAFKLTSQLGNAIWTQHALEHKVIIDRFGRFPHRNVILDRVSTADEVAHLAESVTSF